MALFEFTDHMGMPLYEALAFVFKTLKRYGLSEHVKIIAAGKIVSSFDIMKAISLGASLCYSSRAMMLALGCIQALTCDSGKCPTGVATQNPGLYKGLDPADKKIRVASYHANTIKALKHMMDACGFGSLADIRPSKFLWRINEQEVKSFEEIYIREKLRSFTKVIPLN